MSSFKDYIIVDDVKYKIRTSYRIVFAWIKLIENPYMDPIYKQVGTYHLFFYDKYPNDVEKVFLEIQDFVLCGEKPILSEEANIKSYDFEQDYLYIWSAFDRIYKIDLNDNITMHWWEFKSRFDDLPEETKIKQIIQIRTMKLPDMNNKEYRKSVQIAKERYKLD